MTTSGGYGRYGYFDPQRFVSEQLNQNPFYNPLSPSPDIFGGIRGTLNLMWGLREARREQEEEQKRLEWERGIEERKLKADEARAYGSLLNKNQQSEWEARWGIIDKLPLPEDQKIGLKLKEFDIGDIEAKPMKGALKLMQQQGVDPATASPKVISEFNKAAIQFMDNDARTAEKNADQQQNLEGKTQARHIMMLNGMIRDIDSTYNRTGEQIQSALKSGQFSDQPTIQIKKGQRHEYIGGEKAKEDMLMPNKKYKPYETAIAEHQKLKDIKDQLYDYLGYVESGGVIQPEDMTKITALVKQGPRYKKYGNLPPDIVYLAEVNKWTPEQAQSLYQQYLLEQQGVK